MKKHLLIITVMMLAVLIAGCSSQKENNPTIIGGADGPTSIYLAPESDGDDINATLDQIAPIPGTWQTASMGYEDDGTMYPEYHVQFTVTDIKYGHMKDGEFVLDHSDKITFFNESAEGDYKIQAESANGVKYTYQTAESDKDILEYYETWNEDEFPDAYRGGASLSRSE